MKSTKSKSGSAASSAAMAKTSGKPEAAKTKSKTTEPTAAPAKVQEAAQSATKKPSTTGKPKLAEKASLQPKGAPKKPVAITAAKTPALMGGAPKKASGSLAAAVKDGGSSKKVPSSPSKSKESAPAKVQPAEAKPLESTASGPTGRVVAATRAPTKVLATEKKSGLDLKKQPAPEIARARSKAQEPVLPSILFEEDPPAPVPAAKPRPESLAGSESPAGPVPTLVEPAPIPVEPSRLSGKLLLVAQNPNTLFVYCDITGSSLEQARVNASGGKLYIRIHRHETPVASFQQSEFPLGTHGFLIQVSDSGSTYTAELGCFADEPRQRWVSLLTSEPASTPEVKADPLAAEDARFGDVLYLVQSAIEKQVPLVEIVQHLHLTGQLREEELTKLAEVPWPADYAAILRELSQSAKQWKRPSSLEFLRPLAAPKQTAEAALAPRLRKQFPTSPKPAAAAGPGQSAADTAKKGFWFNVNVEIVVYGSTQPDAKVKLAGRRVKLLPDGSFSMRYALPDGAYGVDASAGSADESETRHVHLHFSRATARDGEVGQHAQDPTLRPPG